MARSKCSKDLYKSFLQASSVRYSGKALARHTVINNISLDLMLRKNLEVYKEILKISHIIN
ncbi:MAG: hypothetical protein O7C62_07615 [Rickettsia endosymbiont of Ixodes persulcatus]|nr:hypothetical protein [Rickettsia endosymbiont of Ixodes persulcatus]